MITYMHSFKTEAGKACREHLPTDRVARHKAFDTCIAKLGFTEKFAALRGEKLTEACIIAVPYVC